MKLYFAGAEASEMWRGVRLKCGVRQFLMSYYHLKSYPPMQGVDLLIDSGGFTARTKGVPIPVEEFAQWLVKHDIKVTFNLDTNDVNETLRNQAYLEKYTRAYVIPVYHMSDYEHVRELLQDFLRYPYISIGGVAGERGNTKLKDELYKYVFRHTRDRIRVHGLGITSKTDMEAYPWYSVDSTSWLSAARYGRSLMIKDERLMKYRAKERHYLERTEVEIKGWLDREKHTTSLWDARGVTWTAPDLRRDPGQ